MNNLLKQKHEIMNKIQNYQKKLDRTNQISKQKKKLKQKNKFILECINEINESCLVKDKNTLCAIYIKSFFGGGKELLSICNKHIAIGVCIYVNSLNDNKMRLKESKEKYYNDYYLMQISHKLIWEPILHNDMNNIKENLGKMYDDNDKFNYLEIKYDG